MTTDDDFRERLRLYERTRDELHAISKSVSDNYDRALLTLSSAFLGGSLALTNQVVTIASAKAKWLLYLSWASFSLTIVLTLVSFIYGLFTLETLRRAAERYYMRMEQEAWEISKKVQQWIMGFVVACGVSFGAGIALLAIFISINI